jgi:hypothetical protein
VSSSGGIADLSGVRLKLARANKHLNKLEAELKRFTTEDSELPEVQIRSDGPWTCVDLLPFPKAPSPDLSLIAGDAIYNLRATLDYLIWQLILREGKRPGVRHAFPIYEKRPEFISQVEAPPKGRENRSPLYGIPVSGDVWTIIEQAQPYRRGQHPAPLTHPLAVLHRLSNIDKHHSPLAWLPFADQRGIPDLMGWNPMIAPLETIVAVPGPVSPERPTELIRFRFPEGIDPGMYMKGPLAMRPCVGDPGLDMEDEGIAAPVFYLWLDIAPEVERIVNAVAGLPRVVG